MNRWNKYLIHKSHYKMKHWLIAKNYKTRRALAWAGVTESQAISTHRFLEQNSWNASELRIRIAILIPNSGPKSTWTYPLTPYHLRIHLMLFIAEHVIQEWLLSLRSASFYGYNIQNARQSWTPRQTLGFWAAKLSNLTVEANLTVEVTDLYYL